MAAAVMSGGHNMPKKLPCQFGWVRCRGSGQVCIVVLSGGRGTSQVGPLRTEQRRMPCCGDGTGGRSDPISRGMVTVAAKTGDRHAADDGGTLLVNQRFIPGGMIGIRALVEVDLTGRRLEADSKPLGELKDGRLVTTSTTTFPLFNVFKGFPPSLF